MKKFFLLTVSGTIVLYIAPVSSVHALLPGIQGYAQATADMSGADQNKPGTIGKEWQKTPCKKSLLSDYAHGALLAQAGTGGGANAGGGAGAGKSSGNVSRSGHGRSKMGEGYDATSHRKKDTEKKDTGWPEGEWPEGKWPGEESDDSDNEE
jgi:hypothetical protein